MSNKKKLVDLAVNGLLGLVADSKGGYDFEAWSRDVNEFNKLPPAKRKSILRLAIKELVDWGKQNGFKEST